MTAAARPLSPPTAPLHPECLAASVQPSSVPPTAIDPPPVAHAVAILRHSTLAIHVPLDDAAAGAMGTIYSRYRDMMLATACRVLDRRTDAEDVVHDVFARLPRLIAQYNGHGLGGWLGRVVRNEALMLCRRAHRRAEVGVVDAALVADEPRRPAHDDDIGNAIAQLPLPLREVVVLRHFVGCTHREVAELLGISTSASEIRLCRAIKRLRLTLGAAERSTPAEHRHESSPARRASSR